MMLKNNYQDTVLEAGCDEAGRGCLAGSVFAAAVILPQDFYHPLLNDSKKMTERQREQLRPIIEREALAWAVAEVTPSRIDEINILNAAFEAMSKAVKALTIEPELLLIDGNRFRTDLTTPYQCIVKGDSIYANIAAASVLAKTYRDDHMRQIAEEFPHYNWAKSKGYATKGHYEAILQHGVTPYHRQSFKLYKE